MSPSATFLGFIATFISLILSYCLAGFRPFFMEISEFTFDYILLCMIFGMALRHQIRVVFMDNFYVAHCKTTDNWRIEFWLVLVISAFGGMILTVYSYGATWISSFMVFYCILFAVFGYQVFQKMMSSISFSTGLNWRQWKGFPKDLWPVTISLVVDGMLLLLWIYWWAAAWFDQFQEPNALDTAFALVLIGIAALVEYSIVFHGPVKERLGDAKRMLT